MKDKIFIDKKTTIHYKVTHQFGSWVTSLSIADNTTPFGVEVGNVEASLKSRDRVVKNRKIFCRYGAQPLPVPCWAPRTAMATSSPAESTLPNRADWDTDTDNESVNAQVGRELVRPDTAERVSGGGFLNIATSSGWVVQNMYVANPSEAADLLLPSADGTTDVAFRHGGFQQSALQHIYQFSAACVPRLPGQRKPRRLR